MNETEALQKKYNDLAESYAKLAAAYGALLSARTPVMPIYPQPYVPYWHQPIVSSGTQPLPLSQPGIIYNAKISGAVD